MATENPARPALTGTRPLFAFPIGENQLQVVFPEDVDRASAEQPANYSTEKGLRILKATVHDNAERSGADQVKIPAASGGAFRAGGHYADIARFASTCPYAVSLRD